jgi:predicted Zn-dependent peptidase
MPSPWQIALLKNSFGNTDNGLHVILHHDSAPVVITSVMYHVGSKDENPRKQVLPTFFEHLLFEGTKT